MAANNGMYDGLGSTLTKFLPSIVMPRILCRLCYQFHLSVQGSFFPPVIFVGSIAP